jgi:ABC-2 type transport system ATP-binding protein
MIDVQSVAKSYGRRRRVPALRDVTASIARGRVTAIVGPNGAGKSTLFGVILGFLRASAGSVTIAGQHPQDYVLDHGIGYMPDRFSLPAGWPVGRAIDALGRMNGLDRNQIDSAMASFDVTSERGKNVGMLSRGLLQRIGLAHAFSAQHDLLVLDEPAEGLDPVWRLELRDRIAARRADGRTVLLASHDMAEVERVADSVIVLENGTVREVIDLKSTAGSGTAAAYRIELAREFAELSRAFPDAESITPSQWLVTVAGIADLNRRLAVLIDIGGEIRSVTPLDEPLEERVRRSIT